jgi:hypothetical protein
LQLGTPAPASAATIDMTATCGPASYVGGRLRQEFNVTISGPPVGAGQQFSTSGWTMNTAPQYYFNSTPSPGTTPYPFSGTMTADLIDDPFNPGQTATNPDPGSNPPYTSMTYITSPLGGPGQPTFFHRGFVVVNCPVPAFADPLSTSNFGIAATSGVTFSSELDNHIGGGSAPFNFSIVTPPTNGTLTLITDSPFQQLAGAFTYRGNKGTAGTDSFVYQVSDSTETIKTGTATINYAAPTVSPTPYSMREWAVTRRR